MATMKHELKIDMAPINEAVEEFKRLWADGKALPTRLVRRVRTMLELAETKRNGGMVEMGQPKRGHITAYPGHELMCVLAELRAIRGAAR